MHRIYLSPHFDDICFSLGGFVEQSGGLLLNLFTRCEWTAYPVTPRSGQSLTDHVSALRRSEDIAFATEARLEREDLPLSDARVKGDDSLSLAGIDGVVADLTEHLIPRVFEIWDETNEPRSRELFCPLAIGGHRDHVATLMAIRDALPALQKRCTVFFYEDLHYASNKAVRLKGLQRAHEILVPRELTPRILMQSKDRFLRKMSLVEGYKSQLFNPPRHEDFIPASAFASFAHEIIWQAT